MKIMNKTLIGRCLLFLLILGTSMFGIHYFKMFVDYPIVWIYIIPLSLFLPITLSYAFVLTLIEQPEPNKNVK